MYLTGSDSSIVVCISPLTSLIMDQKSKFLAKNIRTEYVGETQTDTAAITSVIKGEVQLVLISPESILMNPNYRNMLLTKVYKANLVALVVDEAHCVKTWYGYYQLILEFFKDLYTDFHLHRGESFRLAFAEIGTLRSIIPPTVNVIAFTATANKTTLDVVIEKLSMKAPVVIGTSPDRPNIYLSVQPYLGLNELSDVLSHELLEFKNLTPKTVIFCLSFTSCYQLYDCIQKKLKENFTFPASYPDIHRFRLVEMYHGGCMSYVRENVLASLTTPSSTTRIVIGTSSFGMGIDCPNIRKILHWGTPENIEQYVQEIGRAGRDGDQSVAILMHHRHYTISENMLVYVNNLTKCRRTLAFKDFLFYTESNTLQNKCSCCDICKRNPV